MRALALTLAVRRAPDPAERRSALRALRAPLVAMLLAVAGCADVATAPPTAAPGTPRRLLVPVPATYTQVSAGSFHNCAVTSAGTVRCWGVDNNDGRTKPPVGLANVVQVDAGSWHNCAVTTAGTVTCWVYDADGQASPPAGLVNVVQVSAGERHACAVTSGRTVTCWGGGDDGRATVPAGLADVAQVSAGTRHTCAVTEGGTVTCWGGNVWQQVTPPGNLAAVTQVSAGWMHTCVRTTAGRVTCWGNNSYGQLDVPADLAGVRQVSAGGLTSCAVTDAGTVRCWGYNGEGQATPPTDLAGVTHVAVGEYHVCAGTNAGTVRCWGQQHRGQTTPPSPNGTTRVLPVATFEAPASAPAGRSFTLALRGAQVPGYPAATQFTYAFDCGDGQGYGAAAVSETATCPTGAAGTRTVRGRVIDQDGDATEYTATVAVELLTRQPQTITFAAPASATLGSTLTLSATGGASGNPVTFSTESATCTVAGSTVTFSAVGACTVVANQAGDATHLDAPPVARTIVVAWPFTGFFAPVQNLPVVNVMEAGRAVPLKFALGGDRGLAIFAAGSPSSQAVACQAGAATDPVELTVTAGSSSLSYDAARDRYTYTWKTERAWAGSCRQLLVRLADGTEHRASFRFR